MKTTRILAIAMLIVGGSLALYAAQAQQPGIRRTDLQQHDLSAPGREVVQNRVEIAPEVPPFKHKHPAEEIIYVLEGSLEYQVEGRPPTIVDAGEVIFVPAETIHAVKNVGAGNARSSPRTSSRRGSR